MVSEIELSQSLPGEKVKKSKSEKWWKVASVKIEVLQRMSSKGNVFDSVKGFPQEM